MTLAGTQPGKKACSVMLPSSVETNSAVAAPSLPGDRRRRAWGRIDPGKEPDLIRVIRKIHGLNASLFTADFPVRASPATQN